MRGDKIHVWVDKWLLCLLDASLKSVEGVEVDRDQQVESIIDHDTGNWNLEPIIHALSTECASAIRSVQIGSGRM
ncbi:unnamed protein product [Prunus armeniaca]|uniref:Uncharacterized protein n=1 Tax=Prunus armeniaca TaxID=36596 RepID=A0A6J5V056_PRUAR|nr:unnamed protein product [Prunus armeniaca]